MIPVYHFFGKKQLKFFIILFSFGEIQKGKPLAWRDAKSFSFVFLFEFFVGDCPIRKTLLN
ncbi:hypothetical protein D7Y09_13655 [bacterium 1XD42-1]|jgi:hypothetical protein|nr:hypothetical protein D7Y09_13655 [bacterium 1XD42-1]